MNLYPPYLLPYGGTLLPGAGGTNLCPLVLGTVEVVPWLFNGWPGYWLPWELPGTAYPVCVLGICIGCADGVGSGVRTFEGIPCQRHPPRILSFSGSSGIVFRSSVDRR